ncbi:SUF system Fe-S cluster assembly protein [Microvirga tunisiensis]|uniref:SUF system Fe-S cluster assembly protein n=2 Tax=Pannonibacter tanglangensis TaxID=2750084 RepID=A0A7X5F1C7_9HYPH|nr:MULTISPECIES: SUF system Fe-S cluster assembly protein [unclassified Pannonibacter]NBN62241.1 SUF system Fe-S cluster assembly protein [Pannonibacter sp. XCT-34]NBN77908.1 SUF system Fe-S cluster assembly protein [Pannonibacter sp. XCT-53]
MDDTSAARLGTDAAPGSTALQGDSPAGEGSAAAPVAAIPEAELAALTDNIVAALKTVYDPEIPCDIYELGLVYKVDIEDDRSVKVDMTLTAPGCPVAGEMPGWVENAIASVPGVGDVEVRMVFDPPWTPDRMSEEARVALNWY